MSVALAHSCGSGFWLTRDYGLAEVSSGLESHTVLGHSRHTTAPVDTLRTRHTTLPSNVPKLASARLPLR